MDLRSYLIRKVLQEDKNMVETIIISLLTPYLIYKLEKFDTKQAKMLEDIIMIKQQIPKRAKDMV